MDKNLNTPLSFENSFRTTGEEMFASIGSEPNLKSSSTSF